MSLQRLFYAILAMGGVMFALRVVPILFFKKKIKNKFVNSFLAYIPYAVLTSMAFPEVFSSTSSVVSASIGVVAAAILSYCGQSLVVVSLSATVVAFIVERLMGL